MEKSTGGWDESDVAPRALDVSRERRECIERIIRLEQARSELEAEKRRALAWVASRIPDEAGWGADPDPSYRYLAARRR
jgi:hypothetical protein